LVLKSLEIQGFKSFPDKTKIQFGQGLTAVVGPNGSGKSNISDAVRWVMGEQSTRTLRGSKMEDVIFTGTKARKSQGFAEVSLVIDNSDRTLEIDCDEVIITRRYDRSGESEYQINHANVRLKDINELFMDTGLGRDGYAMVGQGKIAEIVQSKSEERREIFEEAAGISKYRYRKNEAERKLAAAEENLLRLRDILSELEERVGPLKEQSEKAKRFLALSEEKKTLEISVWVHTLSGYNAALKDQRDKILARQLEQTEIEKQIDSYEQQIQKVYDQMQQYLVDMEQLRHTMEETKQQIADFGSQIAVLENDIHHNEQNKARIEEEAAQHGQSRMALADQLAEQERYHQQLTDQLSGLDQNISDKEQELLLLTQKTDQYSAEVEKLNLEMNQLMVMESQLQMTILQKKEQMKADQQQLTQNQEILAQKRIQLQQQQTEQEQAAQLAGQLAERMESLQNSLRGCQMKMESREKQYQEMLRQQNQLELQGKEAQHKAKLLEDLEKNLEGFAYSVKAVLKQGKHGVLQGILGSVSQLIDVKEEYSVAIETALGGTLQNIVVEQESHAKSAIRYLKQENAGRATFLPLTSVRGTRLNASAFEKTEGYVALASDLVTYDPKYEGIVLSLLGRIVVTDDLDTAVLIAKQNGYKFKIVTLDGQVVHAGGSLSGGSRTKSQGILSRKNEIAKLYQQSEQLMQSAKENSTKLKKLEEERNTIRAQISAINSEWITVNEDQIRCEEEQKRLNQLIEQDILLIQRMVTELDEGNKRLSEQNDQMTVLQQKADAASADLQQKQKSLAGMQGEHSNFDESRKTLLDELNQMRMERLETQKDREACEAGMESLRLSGQSSDEQMKRLEEQKHQYDNQNREIRQQISQLQQETEQKNQFVGELQSHVAEKMKLRTECEAKTTVLRKEEREISTQKENVMQQLARLEERVMTVQKDYDTIINKLWDEYQMTRSEASGIAKELDDLPAAEKELTSLRGKIRALGNVNVSAIEEYQEVSERYEFLSGQLKDVEDSKQELQNLIRDLTEKMRNIFEDSFEQINRHFQKVFVDLFGGGRAELRLTDSEDVLESGIEIFVEPPGKIIKNLTLLSGGEQAFVAIAIYFAILKVRPAPFCILDEIEAALDDVNVTKYAEYLRLMSGKTQFIMITHRRGTMEEADMLYGVTMQEEGVSKLLQLNVSEVEHKLGKLEG
jgi:chromosome segregation protein